MTPTMTPQEIAEYLNFHLMTIYRLAKRGLIPPMKKVGGRWRCEKSALEAWFLGQGSK